MPTLSHDCRVRLAALALGLIAAALAVPATAGAHLRSGVVAVDYRATLTPAQRPFDVRIYASDLAIGIDVPAGVTVVVLGYVGEPVLRVDAHGASVNDASPSAASDGLVPKSRRVAGVRVAWRIVSARRAIVWHDARLRTLPPGVRHAAWSVPIVVDGHRRQLSGELVRLPAPRYLSWIVLAVLLALPLVALRGRRARAGSIGLAVVATAAAVVVTFAFALDRYASPGTWILGADSLVFLAVGLGVLVRGPRGWQGGAACGLGVVALTVGATKSAVFLHPIVLSLLPGNATRLAVVAAIAPGAAAAALGAVVQLRHPSV